MKKRMSTASNFFLFTDYWCLLKRLSGNNMGKGFK